MYTILTSVLFILNVASCEEDRRILTTLKYSKNYVKPTVINGIPAVRGQVPYVVSFKEPLVKISPTKKLWVNLCGGSILSETKILTAAHCFEVRNFYYFNHPEVLRVVAGNFTTELIHTGNTVSTDRCQWRKISKVKLHNDFYFPDNDIALVFIKVPLIFTANVGYVVPARRKLDYMSDCVAAGFGSIMHEKQVVSTVLLVAHVFLMPRYNCTKVWEMNMDKYICSYSYLSDVSRGDSGGPLACRGTLDPAERSHKELLVGVVSGKNFDKSTLFTRVSAFRDWIASNFASRAKLSFVTVLINYSLFSM